MRLSGSGKFRETFSGFPKRTEKFSENPKVKISSRSREVFENFPHEMSVPAMCTSPDKQRVKGDFAARHGFQALKFPANIGKNLAGAGRVAEVFERGGLYGCPVFFRIRPEIWGSFGKTKRLFYKEV